MLRALSVAAASVALVSTIGARAQAGDLSYYERGPGPVRPLRMKYEPGEAVPDGYRVQTRTRAALTSGGALTFVPFYGLCVFGALFLENSAAKWLYLPLAGPVIYASKIDDNLGTRFLWTAAVAQTAGALMIVFGIQDKTELVRNDVARVHVVPLAAPGGSGLMLWGAF